MFPLDDAVALCVLFEGFRSAPYRCPADVPTIGYGSTHYADGRPVTMSDPAITEPQARELLMHELRAVCASAVIRLCPELFAWSLANGKWRTLNASSDFVYNLGAGRLQTSTLRRRLRALDWDSAREELGKWVRGGGRVLPGLVRRRAAESVMIGG